MKGSLRWMIFAGFAVGLVLLAVVPFLGRPAPAAVGSRESGRALYVQYCASCHGANLEGAPNWQQPLADGSMPAPPHDASGHTWHHSDELLFGITKYGGQAYSPPGYVNRMPAFANILSDAEITAILDYIKSTWPAEVQAAQQRANQ